MADQGQQVTSALTGPPLLRFAVWFQAGQVARPIKAHTNVSLLLALAVAPISDMPS
jgi:hypothetical protein